MVHRPQSRSGRTATQPPVSPIATRHMGSRAPAPDASASTVLQVPSASPHSPSTSLNQDSLLNQASASHMLGSVLEEDGDWVPSSAAEISIHVPGSPADMSPWGGTDVQHTPKRGLPLRRAVKRSGPGWGKRAPPLHGQQYYQTRSELTTGPSVLLYGAEPPPPGASAVLRDGSASGSAKPASDGGGFVRTGRLPPSAPTITRSRAGVPGLVITSSVSR